MNITDARTLLTHKVNDLHEIEVRGASAEELRLIARLREHFFYQDNYAIRKILSQDLLKYMDGFDIRRMRHITIDFFLSAFLKKICNVYDTTPVINVEDEALSNLIEETNLWATLSDTAERMKLHNCVMPCVKYDYDNDRVYIDNSHSAANTIVYANEYNPREWDILGYEVSRDSNGIQYVVWDRILHEHYMLKCGNEYPKFNKDARTQRLEGDVYTIGDNADILAPNYGGSYEHPFVTYRYYDHPYEFWGSGLDSLIELNRTINVLLTIMSDDTIQESIRMLILNFNPVGTTGEKGQMKTGLRHPLFDEDAFGQGAAPSGQILSADLYNDDVIKLISELTDMISSMYSVDNILKANLTQSLSGIALRLKNEPILRQWKNDINIVRRADMEMLRKMIMINNYYRPDKQISESVLNELQIDYQEPKVITDDAEEYALEKEKWNDGISSPVKYIMRRNPEFTEQEAIDYIKQNLTEYNDIFSLSSQIDVNEVEEDEEEEE
ncbi:MAG: hypothetical protein Unbinned4311contig1001_28 [Prokaryotic dsDNA virus sp.]|nr:MAG: hypothetical protein Unbinned4311contig1001_28 [Prokaryotic dsDNA virus sp.]